MSSLPNLKGTQAEILSLGPALPATPRTAVTYNEPGLGTQRRRATILQIVKRYVGNYDLHNEMVRTDPARFRTVVCYLAGKPDGRNKIEAIADKTLYLDSPRLHLKWVAPPVNFQVRRIIEREQADLVVCQARSTVPFGVFGSLLSRLKPPVIVVMHGLPGGRTRFKDKLWRWPVYQLVSRFVSVSQSGIHDVRTLTWGLNPARIVAIQNGLALERFTTDLEREEARRMALPELGSSFLFGTVGRLVEKKNHKTLLQAFQRVARDIPCSALVIVGGGPLESTLKALARSLGLEGRVHFLGVRGDVPVILRALDVFVFPTIREGLPLSLLEAMASGLPIIASDIGCIREVINDGLAGGLVNPSDPHGLAEAMIRYARANSRDRAEWGARARRRILEAFSCGRMAADYERLYEQLLDPNGVKRRGANDPS